MAVSFRRRGNRSGDPEHILAEARTAVIELRGVLADLRTHLDELEAEVYRPDVEEV